MICFYHNADNDGFCSAAIVKRAYPDCILYGVNYGAKVPWELVALHEEVIVVDFSFSPNDMGRLKVESKLTWIDHHKTAIADNDYTIRGVREIGKAACELTWNYFNDDSMPLGVHLLGRYDVWDHSNPNAIDYEEGIQTYEVDPAKNMKIWERVFSNHCEFDDYVLQSGRAIREYNSNRDIRKNATLSFTAEIAGIRVIAANNLCNSKFFDCSFDPNYHDAMCAFYLGKKGSWKYSLYSPKIDCSVVAQQFGGGGHAGAAGFVHRDYLLRRIDD